jgi:hypothetical protein
MKAESPHSSRTPAAGFPRSGFLRSLRSIAANFMAAKERRERKKMQMRQHKAADLAVRWPRKRPENKVFSWYDGLAQ